MRMRTLDRNHDHTSSVLQEGEENANASRAASGILERVHSAMGDVARLSEQRGWVF